jgi:hypothetical protein
VVIQEQEANML